MFLIIASFFSFFIAIIAFLVIKRKWPTKFKNKEDEEVWHKNNDKKFKIMAIILIIIGFTQLIRGLIEIFVKVK